MTVAEVLVVWDVLIWKVIKRAAVFRTWLHEDMYQIAVEKIIKLHPRYDRSQGNWGTFIYLPLLRGLQLACRNDGVSAHLPSRWPEYQATLFRITRENPEATVEDVVAATGWGITRAQAVMSGKEA